MRYNAILYSLMLIMGFTFNVYAEYWEWGWGGYGTGVGSIKVEDVARYDWSMICFGNENEVITRCNDILKLNPKHKFVVRTWGFTGKSGFMDYLYKPGIREQVLKQVEDQIKYIANGLSKPENLVGCTFQEELPDHFSDGMLKDVARYPSRLKSELGSSFDIQNEEHRKWYGRKWVQVIDEINKTMKSASGDKTVIYWQGTTYSNLDDYDAWMAPAPAQKAYTFSNDKEKYLPFHYADIVKPGYCDGIFGYVRVGWEMRTTNNVERLSCKMFSQVSLAPGIRSFGLDKSIEFARWKNPGNLGTLFFVSPGRKISGPRELTYQTDKDYYWTIGEHLRRIGWDYKIGMDIVKRVLAPQIAIDYSVEQLSAERTFELNAIIHNPSHSSWYGGDQTKTLWTNTSATLSVPEGFSVISPKAEVNLGKVQAGEYRHLSWQIRRVPNKENAELRGVFRLAVKANTTTGNTYGTIESDQRVNLASEFQPYYPERSGDSWVEPAFRKHSGLPAVTIQALREDIDRPELVRNDGKKVVYKGILKANSILRIGPGANAVLYEELLPEKVRRFGMDAHDDTKIVNSGYIFHRASIKANTEKRYKLQITGSTQGGNIMVTWGLHGKVNGKIMKKDMGCIVHGGLKEELGTIERELPPISGFDTGNVTITLFFYRISSQGTLHLQSFDFIPSDHNSNGTDVSNLIEGELPELTSPISVWTYKDKSDPVSFQLHKAKIQFITL